MRISDWSSDVCSSDLFLPHTAYKSYPLSFLERNRFDALTRWLDGLTAIDLGGVDVSRIDSIDDWLRRLEETTELNANHTVRLTGTLSCVPRPKAQSRQDIVLSDPRRRDWHGTSTVPGLLTQQLSLRLTPHRSSPSSNTRRP